MNRATPDPGSLPNAEERAMLRDSVRGFLQAQDGRGADALWTGLREQGLLALGAQPSEGGLREIVVVMEELGRAGSTAPLLAAALLNLTLAGTGDVAATALLGDLHAGAIRPALALPDTPQPGFHAGGASGTVACVEGDPGATHLFLVDSAAGGWRAIDCSQPGASLRPSRAMGTGGWCEARLEAARWNALPAGWNPDELRAVARVGLLARAHGAARRAFELAVDYARERKQFGQAIGRFQAIQHKLADNLIALEGVRLTLHHAAAAFDLGNADWRYYANAAFAFGGEALRSVSLQTHHAFGAIGYAQEHEAPRHFRRVHLDTTRLGGAAAARAELAAHLLDSGATTLPQYDLGDAGNALRREVRQWLAANWSGPRKAAFDARPFHDREYDASFARDLGTTGWIGLAWPREHGGQQRSPREQLAFLEEMERAEAPRFGASVQATALMLHGTPEQQRRWLPEMLRGEAMHGMGYSEPQAGSDLAALRTSAVKVSDARGEGWLINGQKIWTTTWWGKYMFLAARTDRDAQPPHAGISMFVVPMDTPGITIKPSTTMYDGSFANIFYDDVRLPADALVGPVNGGWKVLTDALATERGLVGGGIVLKVAHAFELLCRDVAADESLRADPLARDRIGRLAAEIEVGRQLMLHCAELAEAGATPPEMGAISKVFSGELMERFGEAALDLLGPRAALSQEAPGHLRNGRYEQGLRHSLMWVISIGTNEIQRSLIAQRGLGLPR